MLNPSRADTYYGLGAALEGLGDKKGAIAAFDKYVALEKAPEKQRFVESAKAELAEAGSVARAAPPPTAGRVDCRPSRRRRPRAVRADAPAARAGGRAASSANKLTDAATAYKRAIAADRGNLDLYNDLGNVYFALKQYGDAADAFSRCHAPRSQLRARLVQPGPRAAQGDRVHEAADAYRQYIRLKPDDPDPYYGLGQTLKMLGDAPGAIAAFKKYVGMEKRPEEQKWVDKARAELRRSRPWRPSRRHSRLGKSKRRRTAMMPRDGSSIRSCGATPCCPRRTTTCDSSIRSPAGGCAISRIHSTAATRSSTRSSRASAERLRQYGAALAAYRRALARHAEDVSLRFERGVASALAANGSSALKQWNTVPLEDAEVTAARQSVERIRTQLFSRR